VTVLDRDEVDDDRCSMPQTCAVDSQTTKCPDLTNACSAICVHIVPVGR